MDKKPFGSGKKAGSNNKRSFKNIGFVTLIILVGLIVFAAYGQPTNLKEVAFSQVVHDANSGQIQNITISGDDLQITPKGESKPTEKSRKEAGSSIYEQGLTNRDVGVT